MKREEKHINQLVDSTLDSISAIERAEPKPFLYTRVMARMEDKRSFWGKAAMFFSQPKFALPAVALLIIINVAVMLKSSKEQQNMVPNSTVETEYAIMSYSFENMATDRK